MSNIVGFDCWFMPVPKCGRFQKAFIYLRLLYSSVSRLKVSSPDVVWVQLPQVPALWAALIYRLLARKKVKIVADCHNAQLRHPWSRFPLALWSLKRCDAILVHNDDMHEKARVLGWPIQKVLVLEDVPVTGMARQSVGLAARLVKAPKPWVLFPGSFAADEPINEVFAAARLEPEFTFIITGRPVHARKNGHNIENLPRNVVLPGFLPLDVFNDLLCEADVVMGLTREEGVQLSVCNEALSFGRPLVTSNTKLLTKMFGDGAVLVETSDPKSIVDGCRNAVINMSEYANRSLSLAEKRLMDWRNNQFHALNKILRNNH